MPPAVQDQIPGFINYRNSVSESPSPSTMPESQVPQHQKDMKARTVAELKGATYQVDLTVEGAILQADPDTVTDVLRCLQHDHKLTAKTLTTKGRSLRTKPRLPGRGFQNEASSYEPLAHLLNKIVDATSIPTGSYLSGLRFHKFGNEVAVTYGSYNGLKPGGIALLGNLPTGKVSWEDIKIVIESKGDTKPIISQAATYARCSLVHNLRRSFALAIGFNFKSLEVFFMVFHRSGLSASHPLKLTENRGFEGLVRHIVGILSIRGEDGYGLDMTRYQDLFHINNRFYKHVRYLYFRDCLRGRATVVYSLEAYAGKILSNMHGMSSRTLSLTPGRDMPNKLIYKLAYPIKGRSQEGALLSRVSGRFGVADVIGFYSCKLEENHGSTNSLSRNATFWSIYERGHHSEPEDRGLECIAFSEEGQALLDLSTDGGCPSPSELLETILHAIIGHFNLFTNGVLHRDVSQGNILRYSQPVPRDALDRFECTRDIKLCQGFLIDGDHAIEWRKAPGSEVISGTIPFLSMRILGDWRLQAIQASEPIIHTAVDDLESFLWVLIWVIAHILQNNERATSHNRGILILLETFSGNLIAQRNKESDAKGYWRDVVFRDLIIEWINIFGEARENVRRRTWNLAKLSLDSLEWQSACDGLEAYCTTVYERVLVSGFKHLGAIRTYSDWDEVVNANITR